MEQPELVFANEISKAVSEFCDTHQFSKIICICDRNTELLCYPLLKFKKADLIVIPPGENQKNLITVTYIIDQLLNFKADKKTLIVNLGGGVITDIGSFTASVFQRGIQFINIPTTLLGMTDAAIGGKTGIDYRNLKNYIGTFSHARAVIISTEFLKTLNEIEIRSAWAEIIKTAVISNASLFDEIEKNAALDSIVKTTALTKDKLVELDFRDQNHRQLLNFGHSIGHAYESYRLAAESPIQHGFAVAKGMLFELKIALNLRMISESEVSRISTLIVKKTEVSPIDQSEFEELLNYLGADKKNKDDAIVFSLPDKIGSGKHGIQVPLETLKNWKKQGII